jgi:segregation and condensation protein B
MATQDKPTQDSADLKRLLSALLLASDGPLAVEKILALIGEAVDEEEWPTRHGTKDIEDALYELKATYSPQGGIELAEVAGGWRLRTAPDLGYMVGRLWPERRIRLSKAAMEALAIIAYRQPCTRPDVEAVRGVDCGGVVRSLLDRGLLRIVGRKEEPGRPLLYGTTPLFLETFSLDDLGTLPSLRDLDNLAQEDEVRAVRDIDPALADELEQAQTDALVAEDPDSAEVNSENQDPEETGETNVSEDQPEPVESGEETPSVDDDAPRDDEASD